MGRGDQGFRGAGGLKPAATRIAQQERDCLRAAPGAGDRVRTGRVSTSRGLDSFQSDVDTCGSFAQFEHRGDIVVAVARTLADPRGNSISRAR
jgi:hypothetical protein